MPPLKPPGGEAIEAAAAMKAAAETGLATAGKVVRPGRHGRIR